MTSADILSFPQRPEDRLRIALRQLDEALAEQKRAVTEFRANLAGLGTAVSVLKDSMGDYRGRLAAAAEDAAATRAAARRLEAQAEKGLNQAR